MGRVSEKYDEAALCPRIMPFEWWYSIPSQTRRRIREETGLALGEGPIYPIGQVQDELIKKGLGRLMGTYMRAMQACYDLETEEMAEALRASEERNAIIDAGTQYVNRPLEFFRSVPASPTAVSPEGTFGFHEPRS